MYLPKRCENIIRLNLIMYCFIEMIYKNFSEFFHSSEALDLVVVGIGVGLRFVCPTHLCRLTHLVKAPLELGCPLSPVFVAGLGTSFLLLLPNPAFMMELIVFYPNRSCVEALPCALFFRCIYILASSPQQKASLCLWISLGLLHCWELHKRDQCYRHLRFRKQCSLIAGCL